MKRREFLRLIGLGAGALALPGLPKKKVENLMPYNQRPNYPLVPNFSKWAKMMGHWKPVNHPFYQGRVLALPIKEARIG